MAARISYRSGAGCWLIRTGALKAFGEVEAPIRRCISCNVCYERLTLEKDVACVQNPLAGTEFETLENLEPQLVRQSATLDSERRRVLVIGAGIAGLEAARVLAATGHEVEVWEQPDVVGGQMALALAAPDKEDVEGVLTYRLESLAALGVRGVDGPSRDGGGDRRPSAPTSCCWRRGRQPRRFPIELDYGGAGAFGVGRAARS